MNESRRERTERERERERERETERERESYSQREREITEPFNFFREPKNIYQKDKSADKKYADFIH